MTQREPVPVEPVEALAQALTEAGMPDRVGIMAEAEAILAALPEGWTLTRSEALTRTASDVARRVDVATPHDIRSEISRLRDLANDYRDHSAAANYGSLLKWLDEPMRATDDGKVRELAETSTRDAYGTRTPCANCSHMKGEHKMPPEGHTCLHVTFRDMGFASGIRCGCVGFRDAESRALTERLPK